MTVWVDIIVTIILALLIGGAITYVVRSKKQGEACVGCPYAKECANKRSSHIHSCGCGCQSSGKVGRDCRSSKDCANKDEN